MGEQTTLWYCDSFANGSWQFYLLVIPLIGAFLYGRGKHKIAWMLIGLWIVVHVSSSALTNLVFACAME